MIQQLLEDASVQMSPEWGTFGVAEREQTSDAVQGRFDR